MFPFLGSNRPMGQQLRASIFDPLLHGGKIMATGPVGKEVL
jgi:hypothetical protein